MKMSFHHYHGAILAITLGLSTSAGLYAQSVTTTIREVTSEGTISTFEPNRFVIRSEAAASPLTYTYSTTTRYVDDSGAEITREMIKPGVPVTVYYTQDGERMVAGRVIVHQARPAPAPHPVESTVTEKTVTTTTEQPPLTKKEMERQRKHEKDMLEHPERERRREEKRQAEHPEAVVPAPVSTTETVTTTTTSEGTVSDFGADQFVVKTATEESPVTYRYSKSTEYVDDDGNPVTVDVVKSGLPVTVRYIRQGEGFVAHRIIVHRRDGPPVRRPIPETVRPIARP